MFLLIFLLCSMSVNFAATQDNCPICLDPCAGGASQKFVVKLPCTHKVHHDCMLHSMEQPEIQSSRNYGHDTSPYRTLYSTHFQHRRCPLCLFWCVDLGLYESYGEHQRAVAQNNMQLAAEYVSFMGSYFSPAARRDIDDRNNYWLSYMHYNHDEQRNFIKKRLHDYEQWRSVTGKLATQVVAAAAKPIPYASRAEQLRTTTAAIAQFKDSPVAHIPQFTVGSCSVLGRVLKQNHSTSALEDATRMCHDMPRHLRLVKRQRQKLGY